MSYSYQKRFISKGAQPIENGEMDHQRTRTDPEKQDSREGRKNSAVNGVDGGRALNRGRLYTAQTSDIQSA